MTVAELLAESMATHRRAQGTRKGRPANWLEMLGHAASLRREAAAADPGFADAAWADEARHTPTGVNTHQVLMAFYESKGL